MEHSNKHSVLGKIWIKFFRERGLKTSEASALFDNIDDMYKSAHNEYTSFSNFYPLFLITHFGRRMCLYRNELDIVEGVYRPIYTLFLIFLDEENLTNQFIELFQAKYHKKMSLDEYIAHILGVIGTTCTAVSPIVYALSRESDNISFWLNVEDKWSRFLYKYIVPERYLNETPNK